MKKNPSRARPQLFFVIPVLTLILGGCPEARDESGDDGPVSVGDAKVAAYIRTWGIPAEMREGDSPYWNAAMIRGSLLSDLIIAFALIDQTDGTSVYIPEVRSGSFQLWDEVAALKEKFPRLRVNFSVGGGSAAGLAGFSPMAADPAKRAAFAANICGWLEQYNLDGVDVDWEYPVGPPWDNPRHFEDRENYIALLRDLRDAMDALGGKTGKYYGLSTAVPASTWFTDANDVRAAAEIADGLKLMAYDYYGSWSSTTGHNANLYQNPREPYTSRWSTDQAVQVYLNAGVPPEKIILGVAFYGQAWRGVPQGNFANTPGLYQSRTAFVNTIAWSDIKSSYLKSGAGYTRYWDDTAKAPFLYNGDRWVSYTDHEQIKALTGYVKEKKLGGVFVWEYGHDMETELLETLTKNSQ